MRSKSPLVIEIDFTEDVVEVTIEGSIDPFAIIHTAFIPERPEAMDEVLFIEPYVEPSQPQLLHRRHVVSKQPVPIDSSVRTTVTGRGFGTRTRSLREMGRYEILSYCRAGLPRGFLLNFAIDAERLRVTIFPGSARVYWNWNGEPFQFTGEEEVTNDVFIQSTPLALSFQDVKFKSSWAHILDDDGES